jgi:hypothetical protein
MSSMMSNQKMYKHYLILNETNCRIYDWEHMLSITPNNVSYQQKSLPTLQKENLKHCRISINENCIYTNDRIL